MSIEDPRLSNFDNNSSADEFDAAVEQHLGYVHDDTRSVEVAQATTPDANGDGSKTDRLPTQTAAASIPTEVVPDQNNVVTLPVGVSIDDIRLEGGNLVLVQADGTEIVIVGGAANIPTFVIGEVELPQQALFAALEGSDINVAQGPDGSYSASAGSPSNGGDFDDSPINNGPEQFALAGLLGNTDLPDAAPEGSQEGIDGQPIAPDLGVSVAFDEAVIADDVKGNETTGGQLVFDPGPNFGTVSGVTWTGAGNVAEGVSGNSTSTPVGLTSNGHPVQFEFGAPGGPTELSFVALRAFIVVDGKESTVFTITIDDRTSGEFTFKLEQPLDHPDGGESSVDDLLRLNFEYTVTDLDNDSDTGSFSIDIADDAPTFMTGGESEGEELRFDGIEIGTVSEDYLEGGNQDTENPDGTSTTVSRELGIDWGADDDFKAENLSTEATDDPIGRTLSFSGLDENSTSEEITDVITDLAGLSADGIELTYRIEKTVYENTNVWNGGYILIAEKAIERNEAKVVLEGEGSFKSETVFTITLDATADHGSYTFELLGNLDHLPQLGGSPEPEGNDLRTTAEGPVDVDILTFDIPFTATDADGDSIEGSFTVDILDDEPVIDLEADPLTLTVDEDDIDTSTSLGTSPEDGAEKDLSYTGEPGVGGGGPANAVAGNLADLVKIGADTNISFSTISVEEMRTYLEDLKLTSNGKPLGFDLDEAGKIVGFVNSQAPGQAIPGEDYNSGADRLVFKFELNPDGSFKFSLYDQLDHKGPAEGLADQNTLTIDFGAVLQVNDGDNDGIELTDLVKINVTDDVPVIKGNATALSLTVDEDDIQTGTSTGNAPNDGDGKDSSFTGTPGVDTGGPANATSKGNLADLVKVGADEKVSFSLISTAEMRGYLEGLKLTSNGKPLGFDLDEAGKIVGFVNSQAPGQAVPGQDYNSGDDRLVFEFKLNPNGTFSFSLYDQLDHEKPAIAGTAVENTLTIDFGAVVVAKDFDGDAVKLTDLVKVNITDDVPEVKVGATAVTVTVDEDDIQTGTSTGNAPNDGDGTDFSFTGTPGVNTGGPANATSKGNLADLVKVGADEKVSFSLISTADMRTYLQGLKLTSNGKPIGFDLDEAGKIVGFVNKEGQPSPGQDYNSGDDRLVFEFKLNPDGTFTFSLYDQLDHAKPAVPGTAFENTLTIDFGAVVQASDNDGDSVKLTNLVKVNVTDDIPEVKLGATPVTVTVDEDDIRTNTSTGTSPNDGNSKDFSYTGSPSDNGMGPANATSTVNLSTLVKVGADEKVSFSLISTADMRNYLQGLKLTSNGKPLGFDLDEAGKIVGFVNKEGQPSPGQDYNSGDDRLVFEFTLNPDGTFKFSLHDQLDHVAPAVPGTADENTLIIDFGAVLQATDNDGDSVKLTDLVKVNIKDDVPVVKTGATPVTVTVDEDDIRTNTSTGTSPNDGNSKDFSYTGSPSDNTTGPANATSVVNLSSLVTVGADENVSFSLISKADMRSYLQSLNLTSEGKPLGFDLDQSGKIIGFVNAPGGDVPGQKYDSVDRLVFEFKLNPNGTVTFSLYDQLDHVSGEVKLDSLTIDFGAVLQATDKDGDSVKLTGLVNVNVTDDNPETGSNPTVVVEDDDLFKGIDGGTGDDDAPQNVNGILAHKFGADGGSIAWVAGSTTTDGGASGFTYSTTNNGTLLIKQDGTTVITVSLNASTGQYTVTQVAPLMHANGDNENNQTFTLTYKVTDGDKDTATGTLTINVDDDMPKVSNNVLTVTVDEDDIASVLSWGNHPNDGAGDGSTTEGPFMAEAATTRGSAADVVAFGADGAKIGGGFSFASDALSTMTNVGLSSKGVALAYTYVGGALVAYANTPVVGGAGFDVGDRVVFTLTLDKSTGEFVYRQYDQLDHVDGGKENTALKVPGGSIAGIDIGAIIDATDRDGDTVPLDGKIIVKVVDDMPEVSIWTDQTTRVDETAGNNDNLTDPMSVFLASQLFSSVGSRGSDLDMPVRYARDNVVDFSINGGADDTGLPGTVNASLTLQIDNANSGLFTTDGKAITLSKEGELVVGRIPDGTAAFAIHIDSTGHVTVAQYLSLQHSLSGTDPDDDLNLSGKISAVLTVTDYDKDTVIETVKIGSKIFFDDDGPSVGTNPNVALDDENLANGISGGTNDDGAPKNVHGFLSHDFGADGGSIAWVVGSTTSTGGAANLTYEPGENGALLIKQNGTTIITVALNASTGEYTVTQVAPLMHADGNNENNQKFTLTYKVTDGDNDSVNGKLVINVDDDMPKVRAVPPIEHAATELVSVTGTLSTQVGFGADGMGKYTVEKDNLSTSLTSLKSNGSSLTFSVVGDTLYAKVGNDTIFTFTVNPQTGAYSFVQTGPIDHVGQVPSFGNYISVPAVSGPKIHFVGDLTNGQDIVRITNSGSTSVTWGVDTDNNGQPNFTVNIPKNTTFYLNVGNLPDNTKVELLGAGGGSVKTVVNPGHGHFTGVPVDGLTLDLSTAVTVEDADGDKVALSGQLNITITDSVPSFVGQALVQVAEDGDKNEAGSTGVNWGADNGANRSLALGSGVVVKDQDGVTVELKSNTQAVNVALVGAVLVGYLGNTAPTVANLASNTNVVFTVSVDKTTGEYAFDLKQPLDHTSPTGGKQYLDLSFEVTAKDGDNDTASGSVTVRVDAAGTIGSINYGNLDTGVFVNLSETSVTRNGQTVAADTATDRTGAHVVGVDAMAGVNEAYGSKAADILVGGEEANVLKGNEGDDVLIGGKGSDTLDGGADNDTLIVSADIDVVTGYGPRAFTKGDGSIEGVAINGRSGEGDTLIGGTGFDTVRFEPASGANGFVFDRANANLGLSGVEKFVGSDGDDIILLPKSYTTSDTTLIEIDGGKGNDILQGSDAQGDKITGGEGNDRISGLGGNDDISGGNGNDEIWGGDGNDLIRGDWGQDTISGGAGTDTIYGGGDNDSIYGGAGDDRILGGEGNDTIIHTVGDGNDTVDGGTETGVSNPDYDVLKINGDGTARSFTLGLAPVGTEITPATDKADIEVTYSGPNAGSVRADEIERVTFNLGSAGDTVTLNSVSGSAIQPTTVVINGGAGDDTIDLTNFAGSKAEIVDNNGGADKVKLAGVWTDYVFTQYEDVFTIHKDGAPIATVKGIERVQFTGKDGVPGYSMSIDKVVNLAPNGVEDNGSVKEAGGIDNATPGISEATGNVLANDKDGNFDENLNIVDKLSVTKVGDTVIDADGEKIIGTYGDLVIKSDGSYTYTLVDDRAATQGLKAGQVEFETFSYTLADKQNQPGTGTLKIEVTGANDTPVIAGVVSGSITESGDLQGINEAGRTGGLEPTDAPSAQLALALASLLTNPANLEAVLAMAKGELGGNTAKAIATVWDYLDDIYSSAGPNQPNVNEAFTRLGVEYAEYVQGGGQPLVDVTAKFTADSNNNGQPDRVQSLHDNLLGNLGDAALKQRYVDGTVKYNEMKALVVSTDADLLDRPYHDGGEASSAASAASKAWDAANGYDASISGQLTVTDPDLGESHVWSLNSNPAGLFGTFALNSAGEWTYTLDNASSATQALKQGESRTETFSVSVTDASGAVDVQDITITIVGANDAPVITQSTAVPYLAQGLSGFVEADDAPDGKFEPTVDLDTTIAGLIGPGMNMGTILTAVQTELGSGATKAMAIAQVWDYVDDNFSYYNNLINEVGAKLGIEYAKYLNAGGAPLLNVVAKYAADDGDAGSEPNRLQSLHDNLLGNLNNAGLTDKLLGAGQGSNPNPAPAVYQEIVALLHASGLSDLLDRPVFSGTEGSVNTSLAWDQAHGYVSGASGQILATDVDQPAGTPLAWSGDKVGTYGDFKIDPATGKWIYEVDHTRPETKALTEGQTVVETFTVTVTDEFGGIDTVPVKVTVVGTNDASVITGDASGTVTEDAVGGKVETYNENFSSSGSVNGWTNGALVNIAGYGQYLTESVNNTNSQSISKVIQVPAGNAPTVIEFDFLSVRTWDALEKIQVYLDGGKALEFYPNSGLNAASPTSGTFVIGGIQGAYTIAAPTNLPASEGRIYHITLTGTGFGSTVTLGFGDTLNQEFTDESFGIDNIVVHATSPSGLVTSGDLNAVDVDGPNDSWVAVGAGGTTANGYGTFSIDATGHWTYTLNNGHAAVNALPAGQTLSDSFTVKTVDGTEQVVSITINGANDAPVITSGASASIDENSPTSTVVYTASATDVDSSSISYSLTGDDAAKFKIDPNTGVVTFILSPDYEAPTDQGSNNVYNFTVVASDGTAQSSKDVSVTVNNVDEVVNQTPTDILWTAVEPNSSFPKDGEVLGSLSVTDPDNTGGYKYTLLSGSSAGFTVSAAGEVKATDDLDQNTTYILNVQVEDGLGGVRTETFNVITGDGSNETLPTGGSGAVILAGDDILYGDGGKDTIYGGEGDDTLFGHSSEDVLYGGGGRDALYGGTSNDILYGDETDRVLDGGSGNNTLRVDGSFTSANDAQITNIKTVEMLSSGILNLSKQTEEIDVKGTTGADEITVSAGGGTVATGSGADKVIINGGSSAADWSIDLGSDSSADRVVFKNSAINSGENTVATVTRFDVAKDKITIDVGGFSAVDGTFQEIKANNTNVNTGAKIIALVYADGVQSSLGSDGNEGDIENLIAKATNDFPGLGVYTFIVYSSKDTDKADAGIYSVRIYDDTNPAAAGGMNIEHVMTLVDVGYGKLTANNFTSLADPLVLDLDHNGFAFSSIDTGVTFDINADGHKDQIAWTSDDGVLAYDVNGDGKIDDGSEIFTPNFNGGTFASGVAALASLDGNGDGKIDGSDDAFSKLKVWIDANNNGISDDGELSSLADHHVASISLTTDTTGGTEDGQTILGEGSFTFDDGSTGNFVEVGFDTIFGSDMSEALAVIGTDGDDVLHGGMGQVFLTGGAGADTFVFDETALHDIDVADVITDYSSAEGDQLDVSALLDSLLGEQATAETAASSLKATVADGNTTVSVQIGEESWKDIAVLQNHTTAVKVLFDDQHSVTVTHHD